MLDKELLSSSFRNEAGRAYLVAKEIENKNSQVVIDMFVIYAASIAQTILLNDTGENDSKECVELRNLCKEMLSNMDEEHATNLLLNQYIQEGVKGDFYNFDNWREVFGVEVVIGEVSENMLGFINAMSAGSMNAPEVDSIYDEVAATLETNGFNPEDVSAHTNDIIHKYGETSEALRMAKDMLPEDFD
ncbi:MAG: hypothetical protein IKL53_08175 [Lachnospiraceae bacterium]|nr:hypothetical protein [Lachnospiraceae bacterium]